MAGTNSRNSIATLFPLCYDKGMKSQGRITAVGELDKGKEEWSYQ
jgi:hypothetical protein